MIELRILGALDLRTSDGRTLGEALRRSKGVALLAYLAAARPVGFHRRDKVAALFWPDLDKERARGALRTTLFRLRDDLGEDVVESRGAEQIAVRRDRLWCDAAALQLCLDRNDPVGAAALHQGPMLDGVHIPGTSDAFEQWISDERRAMRAGILAAANSRIAHFAAVGDWHEALAIARRACAVAPDDESVARRLISVAISAGDRGTALRAYEEIERVLRREYDVAPSQETVALVTPLQGSPPADKPTGAPGRAVPTLGSVRGSASSPQATPDVRPASPWRWRGLALAVGVLAIAGTWLVARVGMSPDATQSAPSGSWRQLEAAEGRPPARHHARMALDSSGDGLLVIGGVRSIDDRLMMEPMGSELGRLVGLGATSVPQWTRLPIRAGPAPRPRWMFGAAFDPASDRWFIHGGAQGWTSPCSNDTWVLDHASALTSQPAWRAVRARGPLPPPRAAFELTLDRNRRKLIIFGGTNCFHANFSDTWVLTFDDSTFATGQWSQLLPDSVGGHPAGRGGYAAVYDPLEARLFVFGGNSPQNRATSDLWALDHADGESGRPSWRPLACAGEAPQITSTANAYDAARDSWTLFGGADNAGVSRRDLWQIAGLMRESRSCRWVHVAFTEPWPLPRNAGSAVSLPVGHGFIIHGGYVDRFSVSDVWAFNETVRR